MRHEKLFKDLLKNVTGAGRLRQQAQKGGYGEMEGTPSGARRIEAVIPAIWGG